MDISQIYSKIFSFCLPLFLDYSHSAAFLPKKRLIHKSASGVTDPRIDPTKVFQLSWHPRAFVYKGFLTDEEYKVVAGIEARIAACTMLPEENGEVIQILRYQHVQKYKTHYDYLSDKNNQEMGGPRIATVLMYLSDVEKGGETVFPASEVQGILNLRMIAGRLVVTLEEDSEHSGCPVIKGEKWSTTKWIQIRSFDASYEPEEHVEVGCADNNHACTFWAANGKCYKNPMSMIGSGGSYGQCRKSCKVCSS